MTDRELLELAAKAAGLKIDNSDTNGGGRNNDGFDLLGNVVLDWHNGTTWNPLTNDGDALRLAVNLKIGIEFSLATGVMRSFTKHSEPAPYGTLRSFPENLGDDENNTTRRAIVRAAAKIGRAKA